MKIRQVHMKRTLALFILFATLFCGIISSCGEEAKRKEAVVEQPKAKAVPAIPYTLVKTYPHDTSAFTEGLLFYEGKLFESTGDVDYLPHTRSVFGIADLEKGKLDIKAEIDKTTYFGEGIVVLHDKIYQLTLESQVCFVYDAKTFKKVGQFSFQNKEGWGLTTDGKSLIMSDGTFNLTYFNPETFQVEKTMPVTEQGYGLDHINELEYIKGFIYANVWLTNYIVKIDPSSGEVIGKIDLDNLSAKAHELNPRSMEMNGIAYDSLSDKIVITGKLWPDYYEISFPH